MGVIRIKGARQHNLKGIDVEIPRGKLVVMTGVSGSGKSSLAFHTLYAEGQRRYVESLSAYARQFLDQLEKPEVDSIEGLSPAIAIEQRSGGGNPRSTIATVTEIHDYLRILYAGAGVPHDPETGEKLERMTSADIVANLSAKSEGTKVILLAPVSVEDDMKSLAGDLQRQGFVRVRVEGEVMELDDFLQSEKEVKELEVVVDRVVVKEGVESRLADSVETALRICGMEMRAQVMEKGGDWEDVAFATSYRNVKTGFVLPELSPRCFSFNAHAGACESCHGLGTELFCDPALVVPEASLSLNEGAVRVWAGKRKEKKGWVHMQVSALAEHFGVDEDEPVKNLPAPFKKALMYGTGEKKIKMVWRKDGDTRTWMKPFEGVCRMVERHYRETESDSVKRMMSRFITSRPCKACGGRRLKPEFLAVKLQVKNGEGVGIDQFCEMSIKGAMRWLEGLEIGRSRKEALRGVVTEVRKRLSFLDEVGLSYLSLDRTSGTLSGGEHQRVKLATQLGAGLAGVLYVLDEPSIGLHAEDNGRLIDALKRLRDVGNTIVVVEHDEEMVRAADWVIEVGPGAGEHGGEVVAVGTPAQMRKKKTVTGRWLRDVEKGEGLERRKAAHLEMGELKIIGAREHNLKDVTVEMPLGKLVCVTGPSGSGKSTLVDDILRRSLARKFHQAKEAPGEHDEIEGMDLIDKVVVVDQSPIGKSPRSNPATYAGAFDLIRALFAQLPLSKQRGYKAGRFSFNVKGGRCEKCQGGGSLRIDMHFLADVYVRCEACDGRRYNRETLEVRYRGKSISDVLEMTIEEAGEFFAAVPKLAAVLNSLQQVGLGYVRLGQSANTLSGGEAQRVKLGCELAKRPLGHTLYLLDEPTTGLHYEDVKVLMEVLFELRDAGHSLIVVEHHLDVIRAADWIIDLGPGGGENGGEVMVVGTPEAVMKVKKSSTGMALKKMGERQ